MSRSRRASLLVVSLVLVASACSRLAPPAATVDGHRIEQDDFLDEVAVLGAHPELVGALFGPSAPATEGAGPDTVSSSLSALWLTQLVAQQVLDQRFEDAGLELTTEDRQSTDARFEQAVGEDTWNRVPGWFRERLVDRIARFTLAGAGAEPTDEELRILFEARREELAASCPSGRVVWHVLVDTEAEARDVAEEVREGADFAEIAAARSLDPGSAANGGFLGCLEPGAFVAEFEAAANGLSDGEVSDPLQSEFGWHVILARSSDSFEAWRDALLGEALQSRQATFAQELTQALLDADITVDARFGTLVQDEQFRIEPPGVPLVRERPDTTPLAPSPFETEG
ncbi:MAG: peptidylprolyl isomerase [Acidimicrobiia bacterium]|nr:peptidylprolyl isomerase [Acidimicrobiia bacterium]